jgi:hypothetical protein
MNRGTRSRRHRIGKFQQIIQPSLICKCEKGVRDGHLDFRSDRRGAWNIGKATARFPSRRTVIGVLVGLSLQHDETLALPRGSVDARVTNAFNAALAQGGNFVVRYRCARCEFRQTCLTKKPS